LDKVSIYEENYLKYLNASVKKSLKKN